MNKFRLRAADFLSPDFRQHHPRDRRAPTPVVGYALQVAPDYGRTSARGKPQRDLQASWMELARLSSHGASNFQQASRASTRTCSLRHHYPLPGFPTSDDAKAEEGYFHAVIPVAIWTTLATSEQESNGNRRGHSAKVNPAFGTQRTGANLSIPVLRLTS